MRLSKLYSNQKSFKSITFNLNGLNVIYADVLTQAEEKKNSHDLGKTKLAEVIDFMLAKKVDKRHFLLKILDQNGDSIFKDFIFFLEIILNSGKYLTIRRSVESSSKLSFSLNDASTQNYLPPSSWDEENLSFDSAKSRLGEYLNFDFFKGKGYDFRKAINYSLRMQGDYQDVYKLSKYTGGKDKDWKPFMFDLIGFNGQLLRDKYTNDENREKIKTYVSNLKNEYSVNIEQRDDVVAQIKLQEEEAISIENQIDKFNFYDQDKKLIKKGIDDLESRISDLNSISYGLNFEIDRLQKSISNKFAFNLEKIRKVFEESSVYFSEQLSKDYSDLIKFNEEITTERNKQLKHSLAKKKDRLREINNNLKRLNDERESLLSYLKDTDAFKKFKSYQKNLGKTEGELVALKNKLETIDLIIAKEDERQDLLKEIEGTVKSLKGIYRHTEDNVKYSDIRSKFSSYYKSIMNEDARLSWSLNSNDNVDFIPPKVQSKNKEVVTAKDEGNTYRKLLCVAFDLAILTAYSEESYFSFVYHDDVLSQEDNGIKQRLLSLVRRLSQEFNLQYIITVINTDLPTDENGDIIHFEENEVILRLHDKDASGTLFGFEF